VLYKQAAMTTKNIHNSTLNCILRAWQLAFDAFFVGFRAL